MTHSHNGKEERACVTKDNDPLPNPYLPPKLDPDAYMHYLDDFDMSAAQKRDVLFALWHIMATVVDIGFGMDTVHIVLPEMFEKASRESAKLLDKEDTKTPIVKKPDNEERNAQ